MEIIPMSSTTTTATLRALRFLFSVHGLPEEMVSDNGPQFVSQEMKEFLKFNGICQCLSPPYHPSSNGEVERAVRTFKDAMKVRKSEKAVMSEKIARFLLGYRTTPHTATGCTPAELLMGRRLRTRLDLMHLNLSSRVEKRSKPSLPSRTRSLEIGDPVMVKDYRTGKDSWSRGVVQTSSTDLSSASRDLFWNRHIDQLRDLAGSIVPDMF